MSYPLHAIPFIGALFLLITALAVNVSRVRGKLGIYLGDGGNRTLHAAIRAHGNAFEHGMLLTVVLVLAEASGLPVLWVVTLGWVILAARLAHAAGFLRFGKVLAMPASTVSYFIELGLSGYLLSTAIR